MFGQHCVPVIRVQRLPDGEVAHGRAVDCSMCCGDCTEGDWFDLCQAHDESRVSAEIDEDNHITNSRHWMCRVFNDPGQRVGAGLVTGTDQVENLFSGFVVQANPAYRVVRGEICCRQSLPGMSPEAVQLGWIGGCAARWEVGHKKRVKPQLTVERKCDSTLFGLVGFINLELVSGREHILYGSHIDEATQRATARRGEHSDQPRQKDSDSGGWFHVPFLRCNEIMMRF